MQRLTHLIRKRTSLSGLIGVVLVVVVGILVAGAIQAIQDNFKEQIRVDNVAQEVALLELEVDTKKFENKYYQTDEYIDLQARRLLNKASPGEKLVILPANGFEGKNAAPPAKAAPTVNAEPPLKDRSNLEQWLYFLFGNKKL